MTDNEIIKALECCDSGSCDGCPLAYNNYCIHEMRVNAIALINRQKAEIERLEAEIDKQYEQAEADILGNISDGGTSCHWCIDQNRKMAIKEFAERLTKKIFPIGYLCDGNYSVNAKAVKTVIDNLVKEMIGEQK